MKKLVVRAISFLLAMLMLAGISVYAYDDTVDAWAEKEIDFVSGYNIMQGFPDGNFYPDNAVTRAEIVAVALRMIKADAAASGNSQKPSFSDVAPEHWAFGMIEAAAALDIVNGFPDGSFNPEGLVTYQQAIKIFVSLLGYTPQANANGGYPAGYMMIAAKEDLFNFANVNAQDSASRAAIAVMCYNALQTRMMQETIFTSDGNVEYRISDDTMLDIYFNSKVGKGLVTATYVEGLYGEKVKEGYIEIDNVLYNCDIDYAELLGNKVQFFYEDVDGENHIVLIKEDASSQYKIKTDAQMSEGFNALFTKNATFSYFEDEDADRVEVENVSPSASIIYNNEYIPYKSIGTVDMDVKSGTIELIDIDRDDVYDCIKILSYKDYYINNISENESSKYIMDGVGLSVKYDVEDVYEKITMNGERISFSDIPNGAIASVAMSASGDAVEIIVGKELVEGTISMTTVDGDRKSVQIGDEEYYISQSIPSRYLNAKVGNTGVFILNCFGEIAYCDEKGSDGEVYGYLTSVEIEEGISDKVNVRMLTEDNKFVELQVADKLKFYDKGAESTITPKEFYDKFKRTPVFNDIRTAETQVVKYKLNQDGELSLLRTAAETPSTEEFSVGYINPVSGEAEGRRFYSNRLFLQSYQITDDTICFEIPWTYEGEDYTRYTAGKAPTYFSDGNYYQVLLFDVNEEKQIGAIMYTKPAQEKNFFFSLSSNSPVMIVDQTHTVYDKETDTSNTVISGFVDGEYVSEIIDPEFKKSMSADMLKFGSVIQYDTNKAMVKAAYYDGEQPAIAAATLLCADGKSAKTVKWNGGNVEQTAAHRKTTYGTVQKIAGFTVTVNLPDYPYGTEADYFMTESTRIIIAHMGSKQFETGSFYDIKPDDRIFIRQRYNRIRDVVIYR